MLIVIVWLSTGKSLNTDIEEVESKTLTLSEPDERFITTMLNFIKKVNNQNYVKMRVIHFISELINEEGIWI